MRSLRLWGCVLGLVVLTGCVQAPKKQAFNAVAAKQISTVVVTEFEEPKEYVAAILGHPGVSFGLIGGLIAAADQSSKTNRLTEAISPATTKLQAQLVQDVSKRLTAQGYQVTTFAVPKDMVFDATLAAAKNAHPSAQTVLRLGMGISYLAAGPSSDYMPSLRVRATMINASTSDVLYEELLEYGFSLAGSQAVVIPHDKKYQFADIDKLVTQAPLARQGLQEGVGLIADQIANDLKR